MIELEKSENDVRMKREKNVMLDLGLCREKSSILILFGIHAKNHKENKKLNFPVGLNQREKSRLENETSSWKGRRGHGLRITR